MIKASSELYSQHHSKKKIKNLTNPITLSQVQLVQTTKCTLTFIAKLAVEVPNFIQYKEDRSCMKDMERGPEVQKCWNPETRFQESKLA